MFFLPITQIICMETYYLNKPLNNFKLIYLWSTLSTVSSGQLLVGKDTCLSQQGAKKYLKEKQQIRCKLQHSLWISCPCWSIVDGSVCKIWNIPHFKSNQQGHSELRLLLLGINFPITSHSYEWLSLWKFWLTDSVEKHAKLSPES